ncbi:helix-turn-helix domain-containing protein [Kitasatospora nipponensis]
MSTPAGTTDSDPAPDRCPCRPLLDRFGDRWSVLLLISLQDGSKCHGELARTIGDISRKILTQTLRGLERDGLVLRTVLDGPVLRVRYELTALGRSLAGPLSAIRGWMDLHQEEMEAHQRAYDARATDPGVTDLRRARSARRATAERTPTGQASSRTRWSTQTATARSSGASAPSSILTP